MQSKVCSACGRERPLAAFAHRVDQGVRRRRRQCRDCWADRRRASRQTPAALARQAERTRLKMHERREWLRELRLFLGCADCGYRQHAAALDFDHRPGTVKCFPIMRDGLTRSHEVLMQELDKCEVVCANCHRVRTWRRRQEVAA